MSMIKRLCSICRQEGHNVRTCSVSSIPKIINESIIEEKKEKVTEKVTEEKEKVTEEKVTEKVTEEKEVQVYKFLSEKKCMINQMNSEFSLSKYFELLGKKIKNILARTKKYELTYDILDTEKSKTNKLMILKEKQRQMKVGEIWQEVLGSYNGFINLKIGDETGLDILSTTKKIAIELKNRTNTYNASSKKTNLNKLANFKEKHPEYTCIYANINADTKQKTMEGSITIIYINGYELEHQIGYKFLTFILKDDTDKIIQFVKDTIYKYT